jgi:predicted GH43/DUF377 family glycosyl hydrolase
MYKWIKLGRVFDPTSIKNIPWMQEFAQAPATLVFDDFVRVYFSCRPPRDQKGQYVSYTSFLDLDRNNLFKVININPRPVIELGTLGAFDEFGIYPTSVIRNNGDLLAYYGGWTRCESVPFNVAIGIAKSKDNGVTFSKFGDGPLLSYSINEPFVLSGPKIRKFNDTYYLFYIAGTKWIENNGSPEPVYKIRMATSDNGMDWTRLDKNIIENKVEENEAQASPDVIFSNGLYHMFFCYRYSLNYRGKEFGYRIGYASSKDLINWERDDAKAGIDISEEGWDSEMVAYPHVFELDGKFNMFYLGNQVGRYGFGLAQLEGVL